ncbi:hypothetical protein H696_01417 [Fonticula alba]|uniref:Uncharacterized protein n=1 Tax=Fonticula alba TaxID=691883 RepID=A0A058ZC75_FONAL|nr:hypothetical protein H696_01417 [Fonticula alba]KCV72010.1 hypothetical protein H696_01417 [Fonticula alba]|eukprot:XP_009493588.1 hypothetical protein H696_01417 [Fonticula alba]
MPHHATPSLRAGWDFFCSDEGPAQDARLVADQFFEARSAAHLTPPTVEFAAAELGTFWQAGGTSVAEWFSAVTHLAAERAPPGMVASAAPGPGQPPAAAVPPTAAPLCVPSSVAASGSASSSCSSVLAPAGAGGILPAPTPRQCSNRFADFLRGELPSQLDLASGLQADVQPGYNALLGSWHGLAVRRECGFGAGAHAESYRLRLRDARALALKSSQNDLAQHLYDRTRMAWHRHCARGGAWLCQVEVVLSGGGSVPPAGAVAGGPANAPSPAGRAAPASSPARPPAGGRGAGPGPGARPGPGAPPSPGPMPPPVAVSPDPGATTPNDLALARLLRLIAGEDIGKPTSPVAAAAAAAAAAAGPRPSVTRAARRPPGGPAGRRPGHAAGPDAGSQSGATASAMSAAVANVLAAVPAAAKVAPPLKVPASAWASPCQCFVGAWLARVSPRTRTLGLRRVVVEASDSHVIVCRPLGGPGPGDPAGAPPPHEVPCIKQRFPQCFPALARGSAAADLFLKTEEVARVAHASPEVQFSLSDVSSWLTPKANTLVLHVTPTHNVVLRFRPSREYLNTRYHLSCFPRSELSHPSSFEQEMAAAMPAGLGAGGQNFLPSPFSGGADFALRDGGGLLFPGSAAATAARSRAASTSAETSARSRSSTNASRFGLSRDPPVHDELPLFLSGVNEMQNSLLVILNLHTRATHLLQHQLKVMGESARQQIAGPAASDLALFRASDSLARIWGCFRFNEALHRLSISRQDPAAGGGATADWPAALNSDWWETWMGKPVAVPSSSRPRPGRVVPPVHSNKWAHFMVHENISSLSVFSAQLLASLASCDAATSQAIATALHNVRSRDGRQYYWASAGAVVAECLLHALGYHPSAPQPPPGRAGAPAPVGPPGRAELFELLTHTLSTSPLWSVVTSPTTFSTRAQRPGPSGRMIGQSLPRTGSCPSLEDQHAEDMPELHFRAASLLTEREVIARQSSTLAFEVLVSLFRIAFCHTVRQLRTAPDIRHAAEFALSDIVKVLQSLRASGRVLSLDNLRLYMSWKMDEA